MTKSLWVSVIGELGEYGYTQPQLADLCKCSQPAINDLAKGRTADPRHSIGKALMALLAKERRKHAAAQKASEKV